MPCRHGSGANEIEIQEAHNEKIVVVPFAPLMMYCRHRKADERRTIELFLQPEYKAVWELEECRNNFCELEKTPNGINA